MASRIDIELTSRRDDGAWTWRAAGAREPRGVVDGSLVPDGVVAGTVVRAEVDFGVDGLAVVAVHPPRPAQDPTAAATRIEVRGPARPEPSVSISLAGRRSRTDGRGPSRREGPGPDDRRRGPDRGGDRQRRSDRRDGRTRPGVPTGDLTGDRSHGGGPGRPAPAERSRRRFQPSTTYRNQALAELRSEELPVAEQLLRGGIPRVRQAIEEQNARARAEGRDEVSAGPLLALAEQLLPKMNLATWKDRAASARDAGRDTPLRELRSIVAASSTVTLDDEGRELAATLRQALDTRVSALRDAWLARMGKALDEGRVADALQAAARPPEHGTRLPADLAVRLAAAASSALSAELEPASWLNLLNAVLASPVRRSVRPAGLPAEADDAVRDAARRAAGQVPGLARLLGLPIPPPPGPRRAPAEARSR
jgi:hypothetical protein